MYCIVYYNIMSLIIHHVFVFEYKGYIFIIEKVVGFFQDYQTSEISPTRLCYYSFETRGD